jgi:AraC family transcriptional regulator
MNTFADSMHTTHQDTPMVLPGLLDAAVATFDTDRDASRRYLMRASALLRARRAPSTDPGTARPPQSHTRLTTWKLRRVIDHIETHLAGKITVLRLANLIDVSPSHLSRAFKSSVGVPPGRYIRGRRVALACESMRTTQAPLSDIALTCGFADQSHLCNSFSRGMGTSPSRWRREHQMCDPDSKPGGPVTRVAVDAGARLGTNHVLLGLLYSIDNPLAARLRRSIASGAIAAAMPPEVDSSVGR